MGKSDPTNHTGSKGNDSASGPEEKKKSASEILVDLAQAVPGATFFQDDVGEAFAAFDVGGHREIHKIKSQHFRLLLTEWYFDETGKAPSAESMNQALGVLEMMAIRRGGQKKLQLRVAQYDGSMYYDLADEAWRAVKVSPGSVTIVDKPPILFKRTRSMSPQVTPYFGGKLSLLLNHVRLASMMDKLLLLVYIVTCFVAGIPHPILVVSGEKGAAKTTLARMVRAIVDPSARAIITMPTNVRDLSLNLANNYMPSYDNIDYISAEKSDLLCTAATGGGFSNRTLYTDTDETIVEFQRCVSLNGIAVAATRPDLLDRTLVIELQRIDESERKEESAVWEAFERDRPLIVGGALRLLSLAMEVYPTVKLPKLFRMADFTRWGYAIAEAAGVPGGGNRFLEAYQANIERANTEAIECHPIAAAVIALMDRLEMKQQKNKWTGSVTDLLETLERVALTERINTRTKIWPKGAHILSRRLTEVKSNLEKKGILFDIRNTGNAKEITIEKVEVPSAGGEN